MSDNSSGSVDYLYRPRSYFWAQYLSVQLPSSIQGAERRRLYQRVLLEGGSLPESLEKPVLNTGERQAWGRIHPSFMGGEYLAPLRPNEVEIARIVIASTTCDVTCVYARPRGDRIHLRAVDEYNGDTLGNSASRTSTKPLPLRELVRFFMGAWNLLSVLRFNFEDEGFPRAQVHAFIKSASSDFYPGFEQAIRSYVDAWLATLEIDGEPDREGHDRAAGGGRA
jgi:hypothetical protein